MKMREERRREDEWCDGSELLGAAFLCSMDEHM